MTVLERIKQITDDGYSIEFSKRRRTIPPTISMIVTPENDWLGGAYEFVFLPEQWDEKSIVEGIDCLMKQIEEDKNSPKKRELYWSHNND